MRLASLLVLAACGGTAVAPPTPHPPSPADQAAIAALQAGKFDDARTQASAVLARDARDARAAAVRAIATYQVAGNQIVTELAEVLDHGEALKYLDHERGRAAWRSFGDTLDAIDRDLAVVAADPSFSLELCLGCWEHDWNRNGQVDDRDRKLFEIEIDGKGEELPEADPRRRPTFRFDVGDADWARAMVAFQRAFVDLVLAYRWSELDKFSIFGKPQPLKFPLIDPGRVRHARKAILDGLGYAKRCHDEYLAETDDDREWVPNPRQKSHPVPLEVDTELYATWEAVITDVAALVHSEQGISIKELAGAVDHDGDKLMPAAFIDVGKLLGEPGDIVLDLGVDESPDGIEKALRALLGHGYALKMRASPLVGRLRHMKDQLERGEDSFGRKLRYLIWLN
jgi:hypothetical protein